MCSDIPYSGTCAHLKGECSVIRGLITHVRGNFNPSEREERVTRISTAGYSRGTDRLVTVLAIGLLGARPGGRAHAALKACGGAAAWARVLPGFDSQGEKDTHAIRLRHLSHIDRIQNAFGSERSATGPALYRAADRLCLARLRTARRTSYC